MAARIPASHVDLLRKKAFAHLATLMADGSPQVSPVWVDFDGECVLVNSERSRLKVRNVRREAHVALSVQDPENPYRYVEVRGRVVSIAEKSAAEHLYALVKRYLGIERYPLGEPSDVRVILRIQPDRVVTVG
jgi:PPOX class probable F420-dependent enzyme